MVKSLRNQYPMFHLLRHPATQTATAARSDNQLRACHAPLA
jgi:hypothetical protein